ncbi:hypothetical protein B0O99DRAFT_178691 [Bisporella sp. PMI_857]|nr:hypothetical protein B0O99DRAFT_178691 [Bisporella sp. PMI_857]
MIACRFFAQGRCARGDECRFFHPNQRTTNLDAAGSWRKPPAVFDLKPDALPFTPTVISEAVPDTNSRKSFQGLLESTKATVAADQTWTKSLKGASVTFTVGGEVASVELDYEYSSARITGLPDYAQSSSIKTLLAEYGLLVHETNIQVKILDSNKTVAEIRVKDPSFATNLVKRLDAETGKVKRGQLSAKVIHNYAATTQAHNKIQMGIVSCSWYRPSRVAWLHYNSSSSAQQAEDALKRARKILGRNIQCSVQNPTNYRAFRRANAPLIWSVQVGNLDADTNASHFRRILRGPLSPSKIVLGPLSYNLSNEQAAKIVEDRLRGIGDLQSFECYPNATGVKAKAMATFLDRLRAGEAVKALTGNKLPELGNAKIFLTHIISVKYNVLSNIYRALEPSIDQMKEEIWYTGHIHLKVYQPSDQNKLYFTIRIFGEDLRKAAEAKTKLETLLAGIVVMDGDSPVWDDSFNSPETLVVLKQLSASHQMYLHRDIRRSAILMYGGQPSRQKEVAAILSSRVRAMKWADNTIVLDPNLMKVALRGGWKRIKSRFTDAAILSISSQPKTITIRGSPEHYQEALLLLHDDGDDDQVQSDSTLDSEKCPICWSEEPSEPVKFSCKHIYCKDCFHHMCSSANVPLRCLGDNGTCTHIFTLTELRDLLSHSALEDLLSSSFESHIRSQPLEFKYCPTPDCPQIYRPTTEGAQFFCPSCLTVACIACNVIAHEGLTCAEYKDLSSEGTKAFRKWKVENDVRSCPKCNVDIEKSFGCNHMECVQCKTHICWFCMETFEASSGCYTHMEESHLSYFQ